METGASFIALSMTLPRTEGAMKTKYLSALVTHDRSVGSVMAMSEESEERMMRVEEANVRCLRAAALRAEDVAEA